MGIGGNVLEIVYEYILDQENNIITVQQWGKREKPELSGNPEPNQNILQGKLIDFFGNPLYKLENNQIVENVIQLSSVQKRIKRLSKKNLLDVIRILIQGIEDKDNNEFVALKEEISNV